MNILDDDLFEQCGGSARSRRLRRTPRSKAARALHIIRGSKLPPIGDANRSASDLGNLPGVARFLAPTRVETEGIGDEVFDDEDWLARFDKLKNKHWDNS